MPVPESPEIRAELEYIYAVSPHSWPRSVYATDADGRQLRLAPPVAELQVDDFLRFTMPLDPARPMGCSSLLMPDRRTVYSFTGLRRLHRASELYCRSLSRWDLFEGDAGAGRLCSGMSTLGGAIRVDGANRLDRIDHAVKLTLSPEWLYAGADGPHFRWPATRAPSDASTRYRGSASGLQLGTLLTLPPGSDITAADGYRTDFGSSFATAVFRYGAYIVDEAPPGVVGVCMTPEALNELWRTAADPTERSSLLIQTSLPDEAAADIRDVLSQLQVVADNGERSTGGAGERRYDAQPSPAIDVAEFTRVAQAEPLIYNGQMTEGHLTPYDWGVVRPDRDAVGWIRDTSVFYSPPSSLRITAPAGVPACVGRRVIYVSVRHYRVESRVRLEGPAKLTACVERWHNNRLQRTFLASLACGAGESVEWQPLRFEVQIEPEVNRYCLLFQLEGEGTAWVDDVLTAGTPLDESLKTELKGMPPPDPAAAVATPLPAR